MLSPYSAAFFLMCSMSVSSDNLENLKFKMLCLLLLCYYANGLWSWRGQRNMWQFFFPVTQWETSPPLRVSHIPPEQLEWAPLPIVALVETLHKPKSFRWKGKCFSFFSPSCAWQAPLISQGQEIGCVCLCAWGGKEWGISVNSYEAKFKIQHMEHQEALIAHPCLFSAFKLQYIDIDKLVLVSCKDIFTSKISVHPN